LWSLILVLGFAGCGGGASEAPGQDAAPDGEISELTKRWGPDAMPDRDAEPLQFLYWRVDQMFDREDADGDGRINREEFRGQSHNFDRIDTDGDGFITKQEIIDDAIPRLREEGKIP
jgi:hypothetical protein